MSKYRKQVNKNEQNQDKPRKAVLFARVSTTRQEKEGLSLNDIQIPRMREYAKEHDLEIVREYRVSETGGRYKKRKKFDEMITYVKQNDEITDVIAFRVDRMTRNPRDAVVIEELRSEYHKCIHFVDDNFILSEHSGRNDIFNWDSRVLFARQYLEGVREDGINSKNSKLNNKELPWKAPYGYKNQKYVAGEQRAIPVEPEASIVREIFEEFATGAYSCRLLAAEMNMRYGSMGQKFDHKKIWRILHEPFYMGEIKDKNTGILYPHIHPTLITPEISAKCEAVLAENGETHHRSYGKVPSIYRGFIKCKQCGCDVIPDFKDKIQKNGNSHHYDYYHCSNARNTHRTQLNVLEKDIDSEVNNVLSKMVLSKDQIQTLSDKISAEYTFKLDFYNGERIKLAKRRGAIKQHQQNAYDKMIDDVISKEEYDNGNRRYQEELAKITDEEKLLDLRDESIYTSNCYLRELLKNIIKVFSAGRPDEKRKILSVLFEVIYLNGKNVDPIIRPQLALYFP